MCYVSAHTSTHNAVPCWQIHLIKLGLDDLCDVVKNPSLLESKGNAVNGVLLHTLVHIGRLNDSVLSLLLINTTVSLNKLSGGFSLPLFCLGRSSIRLGLTATGFSCNVRKSRHFN